MSFTPKQVVTMVVALSAAAVLAPVGVMAATGQLVNITDPYDSGRGARVTERGTLWVESRAGVASDSFNTQFANVTDVLRYKVVEVGHPRRIAVTEMTVTVHEVSSSSAVGNDIELISYVRTSGTQPCGGTGWTRKVLRTVTVPRNRTEQLLFNGPPLVLPTPAAGQRVCLMLQQTKWVGGSATDMAVTGFTFE